MLLFYAGIFILIGISATTLTYCMRPTWLGMEREANVESHQYVEARKTSILTNIQAFDKLETRIANNKDNEDLVKSLRTQQRSLKNMIQRDLALIPEDAWPRGVDRFR